MLTTPNFEECVVLLQEDDDQICNNNYEIGHPLRKSAFTNTKRTSVFAYSSGLSKDFSSQMMYYNQLRKQYYWNYKSKQIIEYWNMQYVQSKYNHIIVKFFLENFELPLFKI